MVRCSTRSASALVILSLLLLFCSSIVYSQTTITNKSTKGHHLVRGTKIRLIPPKGFTNAPNFLGFEHNPSNSTIMVLDIPGSFATTSKGITKEKLLANGVDATLIEKLTFNGMPALFVTGEQQSGGVRFTKYVLTFGTDKETYMINGVVPKNNPGLAKEVKKSLQSAVYDQSVTINPFESIDYTIDPAKGNLKYANRIATSLVFTADGEFPTKSPEKSSFLAAKTFTKIAAEDRTTFFMNRLKQYPVTIEKTEAPTPLTINGLEGFEIIVDAKEKATGRPKKVYQVVLFGNTFAYIFYASTTDKTDKTLTNFKNVVKTFRRKT